MNAKHGLLLVALALTSVVDATSACNAVAGDCPESSAIKPMAPCSDDDLECPYVLSTPESCKRFDTSCTCTNGAWNCPAPSECPTDSGADGAETDSGGGTDAGTKDSAKHG